jgi:hypothetical protein
MPLPSLSSFSFFRRSRKANSATEPGSGEADSSLAPQSSRRPTRGSSYDGDGSTMREEAIGDEKDPEKPYAGEDDSSFG